MKLFRSIAIALLAVLAPLSVVPPAVAAEVLTLAGTSARTAAGQGSSTIIGNYRRLNVWVNVTAGSGTVSVFRVWLEVAPDSTGSVWHPVVCEKVVKNTATAPGAGATQRDIVNETAVQTSATYSAMCEVYSDTVRIAWDIQGTTPSETFQVRTTAK